VNGINLDRSELAILQALDRDGSAVNLRQLIARTGLERKVIIDRLLTLHDLGLIPLDIITALPERLRHLSNQ